MIRTALATLVTCTLAIATGCHAIDFYTPSLEKPAPPELEPPRELSMVSLPAYRIVPSDVIWLETTKLVPRPSYRVGLADTLKINVLGTLPKHPINGLFAVETDGFINLGMPYGVFRVTGMTVEEIEAEITQSLRLYLNAPIVMVQLVRSAAVEQLSNGYIVGADGVINLRSYGMVRVIGMTSAEAQLAIQDRLSLYFDSPQVGVEVLGFNSNRYYVIINGTWIGGVGDQTSRSLSDGTPPTSYCSNCGRSSSTASQVSDTCPYCNTKWSAEEVSEIKKSRKAMWLGQNKLMGRSSPFVITGNETVLDALSKVSEFRRLPLMSAHSIWIARPTPGNIDQDQILPINWRDITHGLTDTNYQLMPGDRIYIVDEDIIAMNQFIGKFATPIERLLGITNLGASTTRSAEVLGREFNRTRRY